MKVPRWTSSASSVYAVRRTRALSRRRGPMRFERPDGLATVNLAASDFARSSSRSILSSSSRRGFSGETYCTEGVSHRYSRAAMQNADPRSLIHISRKR